MTIYIWTLFIPHVPRQSRPAKGRIPKTHFTTPHQSELVVESHRLSIHQDADLLLLSLEATSKAALSQVVLDGTLLGSGALGKGSRATEGTGQSRVLQTDNADVAGTADGALAGHASRHLDVDGEVGGLGSRQTANANTGHVLGDLGVLEGAGVGTTGSGVNLGSQGTGTVLVDLVEGHGDGAVVRGGGQTGSGSHTSGGLDGGLLGAGRGLGTAVGSTGQVGAAGDGSLVDGAGGLDGGGVASGAVHEGGDHLLGADGTAAVGAAESRGLGGRQLVVANDGSISLGATAGSRAVTRSAIGDGETGQVDAVGSLDLGDDTVGEDVGGSEGRNEDG